MAYNLAQSGSYDDAMKMLEKAGADIRGVLKLEQRVQAFKGLVQLKKCIHK